VARAEYRVLCARASDIPPYVPWPAPQAGYRVRTYDLDVAPKRAIRETVALYNTDDQRCHWSPARVIARLSPHFHDDFEQGHWRCRAFTHHVRWPWTANLGDWRADDREECPAPSLAVIPPPAIHVGWFRSSDEPARGYLFAATGGFLENGGMGAQRGWVPLIMIEPPLVDAHAHTVSDHARQFIRLVPPDQAFTASNTRCSMPMAFSSASSRASDLRDVNDHDSRCAGTNACVARPSSRRALICIRWNE
jgi:hypothetical protein